MRASARIRSAVLPTVAILIFVFMFAPLVVVVGAAFNSASSVSFPPDGLSTRWFSTMFSDVEFRQSLLRSFAISGIVAVVAAVLGVAFALAATRRRGRVFGVTSTLANLPMVLPGVFIGVALFSTFVFAHVSMSQRTALLGQLVYVLPFVIAVADARLRDFDVTLEEASRGLGYSRAATSVLVTARIIAPAILGAAVLAFALSFDEVYITNFVVGQDSTLPIYVLSRFRTGIDPRLNAVAVILLVVPTLLLLLGATARRLGDPSARLSTKESGIAHR
jgi:ABC-type spermidine/putrescine transport system permease subunit II